MNSEGGDPEVWCQVSEWEGVTLEIGFFAFKSSL
jgi:hypothetical protein